MWSIIAWWLIHYHLLHTYVYSSSSFTFFFITDTPISIWTVRHMRGIARVVVCRMWCNEQRSSLEYTVSAQLMMWGIIMINKHLNAILNCSYAPSVQIVLYVEPGNNALNKLWWSNECLSDSPHWTVTSPKCVQLVMACNGQEVQVSRQRSEYVPQLKFFSQMGWVLFPGLQNKAEV